MKIHTVDFVKSCPTYVSVLEIDLSFRLVHPAEARSGDVKITWLCRQILDQLQHNYIKNEHPAIA